ncbi:MAG TPA: hypothetical protein VG448_12585 [Solirubrobacterales bacterium]|nr:hypothetical protein [Solirubrobacterales bacterium]
MTKAGSVFAALAGHSGRVRNLILIGAVLALSVVAAIGSSASSAGADEACSNEAIRVRQHATQTGECRAWEKVSPTEKGGTDIGAGGNSTVLAAANGDGAVFQSLSGFADSEGDGANGRVAYLSQRNSSGWATHAITPRANPDANLVFETGTKLYRFSEDLSKAYVQAYDLPGATDDTPERINIYQEDTATRAVHTVSGSQTGEGDPIPYSLLEFAGIERLWGSSDDMNHISFVSRGQMVPAIPGEYPNGAPNVYTWDEGKLHLAGILPDGTVPPGGSSIQPQLVSYKGSMSGDGSRQVFSSPASGPFQIYLRIDHSRTDLVSESENAAFTEEAQGVHFEGMTPDGNSVIFNTESPLLAKDTAPGPDLYRWTYGPDPEHESNLTLITHTGNALYEDEAAFGGGALAGMSDDGRRIYIWEWNGAHLSVWSEGETKTIDPSVGSTEPMQVYQGPPGRTRVSPDGNWLAYIKPGNLLYLYNFSNDTLTCATCPGHLSSPFGPYGLGLTANTTGYFPGYRLRYLSDDGQVFFTTEASLVPQDVNGARDVYSYDGRTGERSLVSSGTGSGASEFVDASRSGDDAFFVTRNQLVPSDTDAYVDLYDARVGGGFDEPERSSSSMCAGEACQGFGGGLAPSPAIASHVSGHGNVRQKHRCARGKHRVRRHGKLRCVKRHSRHHGDHRRGQRTAKRGIAR